MSSSDRHMPAVASSGVAAEEAARATRIRRSAWVLGAVAVFFYVGYIAWNLVRAAGGL